MRPVSLRALACGLLCTWGASPGLAAEPTADAAARLSGAAVHARDWSTPPDFEALRAEYAARSDFSQLCEENRPLTPSMEAMQAGRWRDLLALADPWAERCPVDMEAHLAREAALGNLGRGPEASDAEMWARGLFEAALASGDGKTPETAFRVIAEFEEYALLRAFRYLPERQERLADGTDQMTVRVEDDEQTFYFDRLQSPPRIAHADVGALAGD
jgi:hypothetical protein